MDVNSSSKLHIPRGPSALCQFVLQLSSLTPFPLTYSEILIATISNRGITVELLEFVQIYIL
jgi:hypothetical protein